MAISSQKQEPSDNGSTKQEQPVGQKEPVHESPCRCKETSAMSPRELLKRMLSDLSIWKKPARDKK